LATPAGTLVWLGGYMELLRVGAFLAFAVWACAKLGGGLLGALGRAAGTSQATITMASICVGGAIASRAGHGAGVQVGSALVTVNEALYVGTWFLSAFFLLAVGPLALASGRRALGSSAIGLAVVTLTAAAVSVESVGQFSVLLWFAWIVFASVSLARPERAPARSAAVARTA
jgi:hypothetical protein